MIEYQQCVRFTCCVCKRRVVVDKVWVPDGSGFHRVNPKSYGWTQVMLHGTNYLICPEHKVDILVDGNILDER